MLCDFFPINYASTNNSTTDSTTDSEKTWYEKMIPEFFLLFCVISLISDEIVEVI